MIDYYKVLSVSPDASPEALREQYRFLLNAFHPDKFSAAGQEKSLAKAEEKAKEINAAYEVLRNPASRREYDRKRAAERERLRAASTPPPPAPQPTQTPPRPQARPAAESAAPPSAAKSKNTASYDEKLLGRCLEIMREEGRVSTSMIQRQLRLGYTQAARLMDALEAHGIIGPEMGALEREILVDLGPRPTPPRPSTPAPAPAPVPASAMRSFEEDRRRLLAEQQRLEARLRLQAEQQRLDAQLRLQRIAAATPVVRRRISPLTPFGCLQGCGGFLFAVVGLIFLIGLSKNCTRHANAPSPVSTESSTQPVPSAPLDGRNTGSAPSVRRALPVFSTDQPASPAKAALPGFYSVTGIDQNDALNIHSGPGSNYQVIAKLPNGYQGLQVVGTTVMNGTTEWVQINFKNQSGWVTKAYLKAQ